MKILIVSKCPTHPTDAGNKKAVLAQIEVLKSLGNEVHFIYVEEMPLRMEKQPFVEYRVQTSRYWGDYFYLFTVGKWDKLRMNVVSNLKRILFRDYHNVDETYPHGLSAYVRRLQNEQHFDICIVNYIWLSKLLVEVKFPKTAIHTHDALAYKDLKVGAKCRTMTAHQEAKGLQRSENLFALQDNEASYFGILAPLSKVYTIYSKYDYQPQLMTGNHHLLFMSGSNAYNQNGIRWFVKEVFPLIRQRFSDAKLLIGGSICKEIKGLDGMEGVELFGFIENPADFYAKGDVVINPVYQGTGLKIKTFEAISYDKVTMVHPHSMEGVFRGGTAPLFVSEKPEEWVTFLEQTWGNADAITKVKQQNKAYLNSMNEFVTNEYKRFLNA